MWKNITLDNGDVDVLFMFTAWNKGDKDPQKVGIGQFQSLCVGRAVC